MGFKRRWSQWPKRVSDELNSVAGIAGIGGVAVSAGSLTLFTGTIATAFTGLGAIAVVGVVGYAAYKAVPPPMRKPEELVGQVIGLRDLSNVHPPIKTLSVVGASQAGKTTLKNRLALNFTPVVTRTQKLSAYVVSLQTVPPSFVAILDGDGDRYAQQFKLAEACDFLCVVVDHNKSDSASAIDAARLNEHQEFLKQMKHHLDESQAARKSWVSNSGKQA